jgi:hypothetical protein
MGCCINYDESKEGRNNKRKNTNTRINKKNQIIVREINPYKKRKENKIDENKSKELEHNINLEFVNAALKRNNYYRNLHGVKPLNLDEYLFKMAFILAKQYLTEGTLENNNLKYKNHEELGMNVLSNDEMLDGDKLMNKWYDEINKPYNFIEPNEFECSNFTQMIWKQSNNFGCGYYCLEVKEEKEIDKNENQEKKQKIQSSKKYYYVALYYPAGNLPGEFKSNVLKKIEYQNKDQRVSSPESKIKSNVKNKKNNISTKEKKINTINEKNFDGEYNDINGTQKNNEDDITFVEQNIEKEG